MSSAELIGSILLTDNPIVFVNFGIFLGRLGLFIYLFVYLYLLNLESYYLVIKVLVCKVVV